MTVEVEESDGTWYAVRCVFAKGWPAREGPTTYEERITVWRAGSFREAIRLAEAEAEQYARVIDEAPDSYLGFAQAYHLADAPGHGAEVFSLLRDSELSEDEYLSTFFETGAEHQGESAEE